MLGCCWKAETDLSITCISLRGMVKVVCSQPKAVSWWRNRELCVPKLGPENCSVKEPIGPDLLPPMMAVEATKIPVRAATNNTQDRRSWISTVEPGVTRLPVLMPLRTSSLLKLELR